MLRYVVETTWMIRHHCLHWSGFPSAHFSSDPSRSVNRSDVSTKHRPQNHVPPCSPQYWSVGVKNVSFNCFMILLLRLEARLNNNNPSWEGCLGGPIFRPTGDAKFSTHPPEKKKKTWALLGNLPKKKRIFHLRFSLCFIFARVWISGADLFVGAGITGFVLSLPINQSGETFPEVGAHILRICSIFICVPDCRNICLYYEKRSHVLVPPILRIILLTHDVLVHVIAHRWRRSECYSASWVPRNRHFHPPKLLSNSLGEQYQT